MINYLFTFKRFWRIVCTLQLYTVDLATSNNSKCTLTSHYTRRCRSYQSCYNKSTTPASRIRKSTRSTTRTHHRGAFFATELPDVEVVDNDKVLRRNPIGLFCFHSKSTIYDVAFNRFAAIIKCNFLGFEYGIGILN